MHSRHPTALTTLEIRAPREADQPALLAAFNRAFARVDPGFRPRDGRAWNWRYRENPGGTQARVAFDAEGAPVAQYAALGQRARVDAEECRLLQAVDSFVDPGRRAGLARRGAFVRCGEAFAQECDATLIWGVPMPDAWRIGRRSLSYGFLDALWRLELHADAPAAPSPAHHGIELTTPAGAPAETSALFERVAREQRALALRDAAWLDWRYARHPERSYLLACAWRGGELRGLCVLATGSHARPGSGHASGHASGGASGGATGGASGGASGWDGVAGGVVCEWLVPRAEPGAARALHGWLRDEAARLGLFPLVGFLPVWSPEFGAFQEAGYRVHASRLFLAARSFDRRRPLAFWARHLWLVPGDTDLV